MCTLRKWTALSLFLGQIEGQFVGPLFHLHTGKMTGFRNLPTLGLVPQGWVVGDLVGSDRGAGGLGVVHLSGDFKRTLRPHGAVDDDDLLLVFHNKPYLAAGNRFALMRDPALDRMQGGQGIFAAPGKAKEHQATKPTTNQVSQHARDPFR